MCVFLWSVGLPRLFFPLFSCFLLPSCRLPQSSIARTVIAPTPPLLPCCAAAPLPPNPSSPSTWGLRIWDVQGAKTHVCANLEMRSPKTKMLVPDEPWTTQGTKNESLTLSSPYPPKPQLPHWRKLQAFARLSVRGLPDPDSQSRGGVVPNPTFSALCAPASDWLVGVSHPPIRLVASSIHSNWCAPAASAPALMDPFWSPPLRPL